MSDLTSARQFADDHRQRCLTAYNGSAAAFGGDNYSKREVQNAYAELVKANDEVSRTIRAEMEWMFRA